MFEVGDVVVCVDDTDVPDAYPRLKQGKIYKVSGKVIYKNSPGIIVKGISRYGFNGGFSNDRFRKLPPAEPDFIQLIRSLKAPTKIREDA